MNKILLAASAASMLFVFAASATPLPERTRMSAPVAPMKTELTRSVSLKTEHGTLAQRPARLLDANDYPIVTTPPSGDLRHYTRTSNGYGINYYGYLSEVFDQGFAQDVVYCSDGAVYFRYPSASLKVDGWLKGEKSGDVVTFTFPQRVAVLKDAESGEPLDIYAQVMDFFFDEWGDESSCTPADTQTIEMNIASDGRLTMDLTSVVLLGLTFDDDQWTGYGEYYFNCEPLTATIENPDASVKFEQWAALYEEVGHLMRIAFDGNDVWFKGMFPQMPEACVKGALEGDKVVLQAGQFMGLDEYNNHYVFLVPAKAVEEWDDIWEDYVTYVVGLEEYTLAYDADAKTLDSGEEFVVFNGGLGAFYFLGSLMKPVYRYQPANTKYNRPVTPEIWEYAEPYEGEGYCVANIPAYDLDGNLFNTARLYYRCFDGDGNIFIFSQENYPYLPANITLMPYNFQYEWDFMKEMALHNFVVRAPEMPLFGIQTVYEFEDNSQIASDIVFSDGTVVEDTDAALYIIGSFTDWKIDDAYRLGFDGNFTYTFQADKLQGEFKITAADANGEADWANVDFGGMGDIETGAYSLVFGGGNMYISMTDVFITVEYKPGFKNCTMTVEGTPYEDGNEELGDLYLVGEKTAWQIDEAYRFTPDSTTAGRYTLSGSNLSGAWKVAGEPLWSGINLGTEQETEVTFAANSDTAEPLTLVNNGQNFTIPVDGEILITLDVASNGRSAVMEVKMVSAVSSLDAEQSVRWFNLQGLEVENPSEGIYIRVAGSKAEKVMVK